MTDDDETMLVPVVDAADMGAADADAAVVAEPAAATGTRRERRMASRRTGGSWPWLLYALVVVGMIAAAATLAVEGTS